MIIALAGKKGAGKSTLAKMLCDDVSGAKTYAFADPIKSFCVDILGLSREQCYGSDEEKNTPTKYDFEELPRIADLLKNYFIVVLGRTEFIDFKYDAPARSGTMTGRNVMQEVGTVGRMMDLNLWVKDCLRQIRLDNAPLAVIQDLRYVNELELVKGAGGVVVKLTRSPYTGDTHTSETEFDSIPNDAFSLVLDNTSVSIQESYDILLGELRKNNIV